MKYQGLTAMVLSGLVTGLMLTGCDNKGGQADATSSSSTATVAQPKQADDVEVVVKTNVVRRSLTRKPLEPEATKRLVEGPQIINTTVQATGRGAWKKNGVALSGRYCFTSLVKAQSEVMSKEETARGNFEVTEIRKFLQVQDQLTVDETDVALALEETLPLDTISGVVNGIGCIVGWFNPVWGAAIEGGAEVARGQASNVDGMSLRGLLGDFGVEIPANVEEYVKKFSTEFCNGKLEDVHNKVHSIEGKSYKIVYVQNREGAPLRVDFTNVDGSPIAEDEWEILKLANVFLDAQMIPDKRVQPGDHWDVDAEVLAGLADAVSNGGTCEGKITVERKDDMPNGDWELNFRPATIVTRADNGASAGEFKISKGNAIGDAKNGYVKAMQMVGTGRLGKTKSKRYVIFDFMEKIDGDCTYRALMTTDRKE